MISFFKNMQKDMHYYLLLAGEEVTAEKIKGIFNDFFERGFSPITYYDLRKALNNRRYIETGEEVSTNTKGVRERAHRLALEKKDGFSRFIFWFQ